MIPVYTMVGCLFVASATPDDPYRWLEEVEGEKALEWVDAKNDASLAVLKDHPDYEAIYHESLSILNSDARIPYPQIRGDYLYNFWQDEKNERGLWRQTSLDEYRKDKPQWETVLDIDALSKEEDADWVWKGATFLYPEYKRCILRLSRGGADAVVMREFDATTKQFIENGFTLKEAKGNVAWKDENTLYVGTDFGDGSMTDSGYPRVAKVWRRGTPIEAAETVYEGEKTDVSAYAGVINTPERQYDLIWRNVTFYESERYSLADGEPSRLDIPRDADLNAIFKGQAILHLKTDWAVGGKTYPQGALISLDYDALVKGARVIQTIVAPDERSSVRSVSHTRDLLLVDMLVNVRSELARYRFEGGAWRGEKVDVPELGNVSIGSADDTSNRYFFNYENYLTPSSLYVVEDDGATPEPLKAMPEFFDGSKYEARQFEVASADGEMIPYFVVHRKGMKLDGENPTMLYGYGGFEIALLPGYSPLVGVNWLERGGVYVVANIRGGGEFGPRWHLAALKENRQRAYDDFHAVAEDLIARKITSPHRLGIRGGSNGGLLVGAAFTQRPDLYGAVVCAVPLLDMRQFHTLLAGASWMAEYGDPDKEDEWAYIREYSPYHNVREDAKYPNVFFYTSTRDDRVHPGHARKMVARMEGMGHDVLYYENRQGGHAAAATNDQRALMNTLTYVYLLRQLRFR